jgi:hypothetical protein
MSCKYTINGKQYSDIEIKQVFSSILSVPGNENLSNEELVDKIKELSKDRFVDINLFTPYQESAYTNIILSEVVEQLGVLAPKTEIKQSASKVFGDVKTKFINESKKFNFLAEKITSEQDYNTLKSNQQIIEKFPEIGALNYEQFKNMVDQFSHITKEENWNKFQTLTEIKLRTLGLTIKQGNIEEAKLDAEKLRQLAEQDQDDSTEDIEENDRQLNESYEDGRVFRLNPKDTASYRVKLFLSTVPSYERNMFGKKDFMSMDQVFEDLLQIGSSLTDLNYDTLQKALADKATAKPYLYNVAGKLAELKEAKNVKLLNEILTVFNKAFTDHVMVLWDKAENGVSVKVISSNRNSVIRQIRQDWIEGQKRSDIISKDEIGELSINRNKVVSLVESLVEANKSKDLTIRKAWVNEFLKSVGIEFTPQMIDYLAKKADQGFFKRVGSNSFAAMFRPNGMFDLIMKTYGKNGEGKSASTYEDTNNAMIHERAFDFLAQVYFDFNGNTYQTGTFQNGENKTIYSYIQPSYLETVKKKLNSGTEFLKKLSNRSFSKSSSVVAGLLENASSDNERFVFRFRYADSLKNDSDEKAGVVRKRMSRKEMLFDAYVKFMNSGKNTAMFNIFTLADKTVTPIIEISRDKIDTALDISLNNNAAVKLRDSFNYKNTFADKLYNLAKAEIDRMIDYANYADKANIPINNFDKSSQIFFLFPALNNREDAKLKGIVDSIQAGNEPSEDSINYIKSILTTDFKSSVITSFVKLTDLELIRKSESIDSDTNKKSFLFNYDLLDKDYMSQFDNLSDRHKGILAVSEFKYNYLRAQINTLQVLGADPALFYKTKIDKVKEALTTSDINSIVKTTMDEFSKRAAMFIAPGSQGVYQWFDMEGRPVDRTTYDTITIKDVIKDVADFTGVNIADAQELVTLQEHIDRLMSEGRIDGEDWQSITDKVEKANGKFYTLTDKEKRIALQPAKPVHSSNTDIDGFTKIDYVKSSTYPMIPEILKGSELDKLRSFMESNKIRSANFESAKKTGIPSAPLEIFDVDDNFIEPSEADLARVRQTLTREGLRTQQEIPPQKDEINVVSQMDRQLFEGLLDTKGFMLDGKSYTGKELKDLKENIRIALFYKKQVDLAGRLGIKIENGSIIFKDQKALAKLLKEEALEREFSVNDINSIKVNEQGNLVIPIYLMGRGKKFEGLMTSIFSKLVKLKIPGTSLVQVSGVGTKMTESELTAAVKSQIIYTEAYDTAKGLQYIRKESTKIGADGKMSSPKVQPAQIFVSQYLKDKEGNLIDIAKYTKKDENGRMIIDSSKISADLLQLIGARIPNQGHSSMLPIEVAGFLPSYMENTVIVPDGITAQMGSDFDVDKLYAYISSIDESATDGLKTMPYSTEGYNNTYESLVGKKEEELLQMYKELHWSVLTHEDVFDKITRSIDFTDIKDEVKLFEENGLLDTPTSFSPMDYETQIQSFIDNRSGQQGTGIFAQLISFLAEHQDKDVHLGTYNDDGDPLDTYIYVSKDSGEVLALNKLTAEGRSNTELGVRSKTDNTSMLLTESVDNTKNKNLYKFNLNTESMNAARALVSLSTKSGEIVDMRYVTRLFPQAIIKNYQEILEQSRDSFNDAFIKKDDIKINIIKKYQELLSDNQEETKTKPLSPKKLLQILKNTKSGEYLLKRADRDGKLSLNPEETKFLDGYILDQLAVFELYDKLDRVGQDMSTIINGSNIASAGIGSSLFAVSDKARKVKKLNSNPSFLNTDSLLGYIDYKGDIINPVGQAGHAMKVALSFGRSVLAELAPIHFSTAFDNIREKVVRERFTNSSISVWGKEKFIDLSEELMKSVNTYLLSNPEVGMIENAQEDRARLMFGNANEKSLGERILDVKKEVKDNYFLNRLRIVTPTNKITDPHLIQYKAPFSQDIDEAANNKAFFELILSGDKAQIDIAKDLVTYGFITGYTNGANSYMRFIPIEYLMLNDKFVKALETFPASFSNSGTFYRQYIQNNPYRAMAIKGDTFKKFFAPKIENDETIVLNEETAKGMLVQMGSDEGNGYKLPDYLRYTKFIGNQRKVYLFEKVGLDNPNTALSSKSYKRIITLGDNGVSEYVYDDENPTSIFFNNLTLSQKLNTLSKNQDNPFRKIKIPGAEFNNYRYLISMADTATQYIGFNINEKSKITANALKAFDKNANTGTYSLSDKVIISGNTLLEVVAPQNGTSRLSNSEVISAYKILDPIFQSEYAPLIDKAIAAGADFMIGNYPGIEEMSKKYLRDKGLTESKDDAGITHFENTNKKEEDVYNNAPEDFNSQSYDEIPDSNEEEVSSLFGIGMAEPEEETPAQMYTPDLEVEQTEIASNDEVVKKYISNPSKPATLKSVLSKFSKTTNNAFYKTVLDLFKKVGYPDITVAVSTAGKDPGLYSPSEKTIVVNPELALSDDPSKTREENLENLIMHEAIHAYTADILEKLKTGDKSLNTAQRTYGTAVKQLYKMSVEKVMADPEHKDKLTGVLDKLSGDNAYLTPTDKSMYYGLTSVDEFASMLLTDKAFQNFMNDTQIQESTKLSALDQFKKLLTKLFKALAEAFGVKIESGSALEQGINDVFNLISVSQDGSTSSTENQLTLFSTSTKQLDNYNLDKQCK